MRRLSFFSIRETELRLLPRMRDAGGMNLHEGLVLASALSGAFLCAALGCRWGAADGVHGTWMQVCGGILGGVIGMVVGGSAGFFAGVLLLVAPGAVKRGLEPADIVCKCRPGDAVLAHLIPQSEVQIAAVAESHRLVEWPEFACIRQRAFDSEAELRARLAADPDFAERIVLAARLGHAAAEAIGMAPREPALRRGRWPRLPRDLRTVLRSGLPPRLCIFWALACAERILPVFEREFHQDTRPRQRLGATALLLRDGTRKPKPLDFVDTRASLCLGSGCRVLHRNLWTRMRGSLSKGEMALWAIFRLEGATLTFIEPSALWAFFGTLDERKAYRMLRSRCVEAQPWFNAAGTAYQAARASDALASEYDWQRAALARMILAWERWAEDRAEWQAQVEEDWIPRTLERLWEFRFYFPAFAECIRKALAPWPRVRDNRKGSTSSTYQDPGGCSGT